MKSREAFIMHMVCTEANERINNEHKRAHRIVDGYYDTFSKTVRRERLKVYSEYLDAQAANYTKRLAEDIAKSARDASKTQKEEKDKKDMEK